MASFKFKMDFLISLRKRREEEAAGKLARRLASIRELERIISGLETDLRDTALEITAKGAAGELNGPLLVMYSSHQERVRQELKKSAKLLVLCRKEEAKEREALRKAMVDRKIIEKVKERQREAFLEEAARLEQNSLEELAAIAKERSRRGEDADAEI
ncbi:MAG: flagellar export protein FliJ [Deltaproteobacteria bacterium]|jgi:flagellar FliJ protein|nr:flagellar export protein FliJ [Deltaproteobacteria bacterium]